MSKTKTRRIIDLDAPPLTPEDLTFHPEDQLENVVKGQFEFDPSKLALYLSKEQEGERSLEGRRLREELKGQKVFSANLLDWLLLPKHRRFIPEEWRKPMVFFWGTIYRLPNGEQSVRALSWDGRKWCWSGFVLGNAWYHGWPTVILAG